MDTENQGQVTVKVKEQGIEVERECAARIYGCIAIHRLDDLYPQFEQIKGWYLTHIPTGRSVLPTRPGENIAIGDGVEFVALERLAGMLDSVLRDASLTEIVRRRDEVQRIVNSWLRDTPSARSKRIRE